MVFIIISDKDPVQATRFVLSRISYIAIPFSVLFIRYFPQYGRYYDTWRWTPIYCGVGTEKNYLGTITAICGVFLYWDYLENRSTNRNPFNNPEILIQAIMFSMVAYLLVVANSSTALACTALGISIIIIMRYLLAKGHVKYIGAYCIVGFCILAMLFMASDIVLGGITSILNRDVTFTGRLTNIWPKVLKEKINIVVGEGYKSFWSIDRMERLTSNEYRAVNAHNGYLETYLNTGIIGVGLLIAVIISAIMNLKKSYLAGNNYSILLFSLLFVQLLNNISESLFNMMSISWFTFLLASSTFTDLKDQEGRETCDIEENPAWNAE
jgi:O-antigen ligase